jgi:hypothetical protein
MKELTPDASSTLLEVVKAAAQARMSKLYVEKVETPLPSPPLPLPAPCARRDQPARRRHRHLHRRNPRARTRAVGAAGPVSGRRGRAAHARVAHARLRGAAQQHLPHRREGGAARRHGDAGSRADRARRTAHAGEPQRNALPHRGERRSARRPTTALGGRAVPLRGAPRRPERRSASS